ncbi:MAG: hypothetical protein GXP27_11450 [Planctomycetes bacterium]|nr:hypothetical protein [Planctomycetota bacterium]
MNYPVWIVPHIGSGWVIGLIAIFHIMISHFAIGGGLYLAMAEWRALRTGRRDWFEFLPRHSKFFLILTGVYGAVSGVGIWFAIGLAAPEATSTLIHNFVFAWAIEWLFFLVELTSAAVYYYTWNRIPDELHLKVGWFYAVAAFFTLFIINGILAFMLTPGDAWLAVAGSGQEASRFFQAFFNPTYWPSLALRILVCVALAGVWALVTGSRIDETKQPELKADVIRWSVRWLVPAFFLMPICTLWYLACVPDSQLELLRLGISTVGPGSFSHVTRAVLVSTMASATILAVAYLVAYRKPLDFSFGYACAIVFLAFAATASGEHTREMLRKPYVIVGHMYSNAIRATPVLVRGQRISEVERFNRFGYLRDSIWAREGHDRASETSQSPSNDSASTLARGELIYRGQCAACHTLNGYRGLRRLMRERDLTAIRNILTMLHDPPEESPYRAFMPPLVGTDDEIDALALYLDSILHKDSSQTQSGGKIAGRH